MFKNWFKSKTDKRPSFTEGQAAEYLGVTVVNIFEAAMPPEGSLKGIIRSEHLNEQDSKKLFFSVFLCLEAIAIIALEDMNMIGVAEKFIKERYKALSTLPGGDAEATELTVRRAKIVKDIREDFNNKSSVSITSLKITQNVTEGVFDSEPLQSLIPSFQVSIAVVLIPSYNAFTRAMNEFELAV